jgi:signal peptidase II
VALKFDKIFFASFTIPFILDRVTKYFMISDFWQSKTINSFFNLYLTHNYGIAWGVGSKLHSCDYSAWLNVLVASVLIYFLWYMQSIMHDRRTFSACLLIFAGGISNFFDRLWYGSVIDFIQLHYHNWYFPVFNVADISITGGAILLIYFILFDDQNIF